MLPKEKVQNLIDRHLKLEKELSSGKVEKKKFAEISKEYSDLNDIIKQAKEYLSYRKDLQELNNIINDKSSDDEIKDFASSELETLKSKYEINEKKIKLFLCCIVPQAVDELIAFCLGGRCYNMPIACCWNWSWA